MNPMTIATIVVNSVCALWLIGLGVFVIVKRKQLKRKAKKELGDMYDGEVLDVEKQFNNLFFHFNLPQ